MTYKYKANGKEITLTEDKASVSMELSNLTSSILIIGGITITQCFAARYRAATYILLKIHC